MTTPEDRVVWESDEDALYRAGHGQDRTLGDEQPEGGSQDAGDATGDSARRDRYAEALARNPDSTTDQLTDVLAVADEELAGLRADRDAELVAYDQLSRECVGLRAEVGQLEADLVKYAGFGDPVARAEAAEADANLLRSEAKDAHDALDRAEAEVARIEDLARAGLGAVRREEALREGLETLADEWECRDDLRGSDHWRGVDFVDGKAFGYEEASDLIRALLASSPAATTGEADDEPSPEAIQRLVDAAPDLNPTALAILSKVVRQVEHALRAESEEELRAWMRTIYRTAFQNDDAIDSQTCLPTGEHSCPADCADLAPDEWHQLHSFAAPAPVSSGEAGKREAPANVRPDASEAHFHAESSGGESSVAEGEAGTGDPDRPCRCHPADDDSGHCGGWMPAPVVAPSDGDAS